MVYFLVIRNNIKNDDYDFSMTYGMHLQKKGYNVEYYLAEDGQFKDYIDGTLHIDYEWNYDRLINENNITVLKDTWYKLPFMISCVIGYDSTEEEIKEDLKELVNDTKNHIDGFNGFSFELITKQEISGTRFIQPIEYSGEDDKLYYTANYYIPDTIFNTLKKFEISLFDFIFGNKYALIADGTKSIEFQKMLEGNAVDLESNTIVAFYNWNNIIMYSKDSKSEYKRGKNGEIVKKNISEEVGD